jgi:hypothetical protein
MDAAAGYVRGDATRLQQVIWNLLSNSAKFTSKGGRIDVRLEREGSYAKLSVTDTGEGIRADFLPYVFDRFRQEDSSRTRKHGGLGLGLSIVQHLIEMHGGAVEASSPGENQGTTLTVKLPLLEQADEVEKLQRRSRPQVMPTLSGIRTLLVEDNRDSLDMLRIVVETYGAEVRTAMTASEAIKIYETWSPDVLVSDLGLPDEDGYVLLERLRAMQPKNEIQAIALTGYVGEQEGQRAIASGFQMYLTKPAEPMNVVKAISELVARRRQAT